MDTDVRLESYLHSLDKALGKIPISQRAEIVTEIKSHVLAAQDKDPTMSVDQILASLGQPETVANRFLLEKGLKPVPPPRSPVIKWLVIGFLGTFGIFILFITILLLKFSPLVEISEREGRVKILGGAIDIDDNNLNWHGKFDVNINGKDKSKSIAGTRPIDAKNIDKIFVPFRNGKFEISYNNEGRFTWGCNATEGGDSFSMAAESNRILTLDLDKIRGVKCELSLPQGVPLVLNGANGDIEVEEPQAPLSIQLANGRVTLDPDKNKNYEYELKVQNGRVDEFESAPTKGSIKIKIEIQNGYVQRS